jgi:hypothetical protein
MGRNQIKSRYFINSESVFMLTVSALFLLLSATVLSAQETAGYRFENYKAKVIGSPKKASINYQSNKTAKRYRTAITECYNLSDANFAGHYIVCLWGCGTGCQDGAMVDLTDGKVYDVPLGEARYFFGCDFKADEDCLDFRADSRLFITQICIQSRSTDTIDIQEKEFFINVWNEKTKTFEFLRSVKSSEIIESD